MIVNMMYILKNKILIGFKHKCYVLSLAPGVRFGHKLRLLWLYFARGFVLNKYLINLVLYCAFDAPFKTGILP